MSDSRRLPAIGRPGTSLGDLAMPFGYVIKLFHLNLKKEKEYFFLEFKFPWIVHYISKSIFKLPDWIRSYNNVMLLLLERVVLCNGGSVTNGATPWSFLYTGLHSVQQCTPYCNFNGKQAPPPKNILRKVLSNGPSENLRPLYHSNVTKVSIIKWFQNLIWAYRFSVFGKAKNV